MVHLEYGNRSLQPKNPFLKEDLMKHLYRSLLAVFMILFADLFISFDVVAGEDTCTFKADADKVHIIVWDEDSGGWCRSIIW